MHEISSTLRSLEIGQQTTFRNLTVFPLLGKVEPGPAYVTLDEALASGQASITEVSGNGRVPELRFVNEGKQPVLLLDGEELIGAKQNRVLNLTVLAPERSTIVIPVSCVEAGRWSHGYAGRFVSSEHLMYSKLRSSKAQQVSMSILECGIPRSDQAAVWKQIGNKALAMQADSPTSEMAEIYRKHRNSVDDFVNALPHVAHQLGAVFAIDGRVVGLEVLDHPETMGKLSGKLVRSYALDAIESRVVLQQPPPIQAVEAFVGRVAEAEHRRAPAVGLGEDVRIAGAGLSGGALVRDGRVAHLGVFRLEEEAGAGPGGGNSSSGIERASGRVRRRL